MKIAWQRTPCRVLERENVEKARREEVQWCRGIGVWEPVLRKVLEAEAKAVSLHWIDTDWGLSNPSLCTGKFRSDGNASMETSFLNRVIRWDPASGRAELEADTRHVAMVLRDLWLEK